MITPTLNLSPGASPGARAATNASYDTWRWNSQYDVSYATRFRPMSTSTVPYMIIPADFPFARTLPKDSCKFFIVGKNGFLSSIVADDTGILVVENNSHCSINIRANNGSQSNFSASDGDRDWSGQLQYDHKYDRWSFCTNRTPKAYLSRSGQFSIGIDLESSPSSAGVKLHVTGNKTEAGNFGTALVVFENSDGMYIRLRTSNTGICGILFSSPNSEYRTWIQHNHSKNEFSIGNVASGFQIGYDKLGNIIISSTSYPNTTMPLAAGLMYLYGVISSASKGPHWSAYTPADVYPLIHNLNWSHDNISISFDCMFESNLWKSASSTGNFQIYKWNSKFLIRCADIVQGGTIFTWINAISVMPNGQVGFNTDNPATSALLDLTSTTKALLLTRMTTTERNALTAVNGMIFYNITLGKVQVYESGAWASVV
jgi:hypothetical protein